MTTPPWRPWRTRARRTPAQLVVPILQQLLIALVAAPMLLPLAWLVLTAFKPAAQIYSQTVTWWPDPFTLENFAKGWALLDFPRFILNSTWVASWTVMGTLLTTSLTGYAFARIPARGKQVLFALLVASMLAPPMVLLLPQFVLFSRLGWVNTYLPLIAPAFLGNAFYSFFMRQYFMGLPHELFESAELDGCTPWTAYWAIALPLAQPALATVAIFAFIGSWHDLINPLVYLSTTAKFTMSLGLALFQGLFYTQYHYLIPMALVGMLPMMIFFWPVQRHILPSFSSTGVTT